MSQLLDKKGPWLDGCHALRDGLLEHLTDTDLAFTPGGQNTPLGELFREIGETEHSYIDSFKTFEQNFSYRHPDPSIATSIDRLTSWFQELDEAFKTALDAVPISGKSINRNPGSTLSPVDQVDVYIQAMMIFFGKAIVYFRAMDKALPPSIEEYIA